MKIRTWVCALLLSIAAGTPALAWDYQGHQMVGAIADQLLTANAKQKLQSILGFSLQVAAPWPDCVRSVVHKDDGTFSYLPSPLHPSYRIPCKPFETEVGSPEPSQASPEQRRMEDYAKRNWYNCTYIVGEAGGCHQAFHFADVAIQRDGYDRRYVGTSDHDVVSAINACLAVLQGRPAPAPFSIKDSKEALFLLAHFVGDLHQPLHVGAIYLDTKGMPVDPDATGLDPTTETQGGNAIKDGDQNLHSEWDEIPDALTLASDAGILDHAKRVSLTSGPLDGWAAIWASETVKQARAAFPKDLTFSFVPKDAEFPGSPAHWKAHFADRQTYDRNAKSIKRIQLAGGGARLAQLLNALWP